MDACYRIVREVTALKGRVPYGDRSRLPVVYDQSITIDSLPMVISIRNPCPVYL